MDIMQWIWMQWGPNCESDIKKSYNCHVNNNDELDKEWGDLWLRDFWQGKEAGRTEEKWDTDEGGRESGD